VIVPVKLVMVQKAINVLPVTLIKTDGYIMLNVLAHVLVIITIMVNSKCVLLVTLLVETVKVHIITNVLIVMLTDITKSTTVDHSVSKLVKLDNTLLSMTKLVLTVLFHIVLNVPLLMIVPNVFLHHSYS